MKRRSSFRVAAACAALVVGLETTPATPAEAAAVSSDGVASAYQLNAEHSGYAARGVGAPPLTRKWRRHLGGLVSYPLIADNKVFVTVRADKGYRNVLRALDVRTGRDVWKPVELGGDYMSMITLGAGRVYALTHTGALAAHDMRTGKLLWWRQFVNQWAFTGPPTYRDGLVYVAGSGRGGAVYAIDAANGDITWSTNTISGDNSSPAVTADGVYTAHACARAYRLHPKTGARIWEHVTHCAGGGGRTPVVAGDSLWIRDNARVYPDTALRLTDGTVRTTYGKPGTPGDAYTLAPAFVGATGYFVTKGV
ncbi:MAG TPA: PQQ-binding-like beta-propeller repeat protein, partial [Actinoplanes sp.]